MLQIAQNWHSAVRTLGYTVGGLQAMESSTKNSGELLERLTLLFNRTRQAKVTTELNEIISGALSLEDSD
jgi:F0F1-type ATP synthase gamma subunit